MPKFTGDDLEIQINPELEEDEKDTCISNTG